jgi:hypothetical protein
VIEVRGFIVSAWEERPRGAASRRLLATGRLEDGRSFALLLAAPAAAVYVAAPDGPRALALLAPTQGATLDPLPWSDLPGGALARLDLPRGTADDAQRRLATSGVAVRGLDRARASDALLALGLTGPVIIRGEPTPGRRVDLVSSTRSSRRRRPRRRSPGLRSTSRPTGPAPSRLRRWPGRAARARSTSSGLGCRARW